MRSCPARLTASAASADSISARETSPTRRLVCMEAVRSSAKASGSVSCWRDISTPLARSTHLRSSSRACKPARLRCRPCSWANCCRASGSATASRCGVQGSAAACNTPAATAWPANRLSKRSQYSSTGTAWAACSNAMPSSSAASISSATTTTASGARRTTSRTKLLQAAAPSTRRCSADSCCASARAAASSGAAINREQRGCTAAGTGKGPGFGTPSIGHDGWARPGTRARLLRSSKRRA